MYIYLVTNNLFFMKKPKKSILLILFSLCIFLWFAINFSSSNLSSSVLGDNDDIQIQINQKNNERASLVTEQDEQKVILSQLRNNLTDLQKEIQKSTEQYNSVQKELNQINADIAKVPSPQYGDIDKEYNDAILLENTRFSKQKSIDQAYYNDVTAESKKTYDDTVSYIRAHNPVSKHAKLIAEAASVATKKRQEALRILTEKNLANTTQHQEVVNTLTQNKLDQRAKRLADNQAIVVPLLEQKNQISLRKTEAYASKDALIKNQNAIKWQIATVDLRIRQIDTLLDWIDRQVANLQKYLFVETAE